MILPIFGSRGVDATRGRKVCAGNLAFALGNNEGPTAYCDRNKNRIGRGDYRPKCEAGSIPAGSLFFLLAFLFLSGCIAHHRICDRTHYVPAPSLKEEWPMYIPPEDWPQSPQYIPLIDPEHIRSKEARP